MTPTRRSMSPAATISIGRTLGGAFTRRRTKFSSRSLLDHDGSTVREFEPVSDDEARAVLAKHAREPVEQYFGSMSNIGDSMGHVSMRPPGASYGWRRRRRAWAFSRQLSNPLPYAVRRVRRASCGLTRYRYDVTATRRLTS